MSCFSAVHSCSLLQSRLTTRSHIQWIVLICAAVLIMLAMSAVLTPVMAQLPNFTTVQANAQRTFAPLITMIRYLIMAFCVVMAIWQGVQAARGGQPGGYANALLLLVVAGFAASPATWVNLLGLTAVATNMTAWGL